MLLSERDLARAPRWSADDVAALPGRCRGELLGPWADNLTRRFGAGAVPRVRRRLGALADRVGDRPTKADWVPVGVQVALTEAIVDELLDGDLLRLYPLLVEDTRHASNRVSLALLRRLGPRRLLALAPRTHNKVYDRGELDLEVGDGCAYLRFSGSKLFEHPTWRLLQLYAQRVAFELGGWPARAEGADGGPEAFAATLRW